MSSIDKYYSGGYVHYRFAGVDVTEFFTIAGQVPQQVVVDRADAMMSYRVAYSGGLVSRIRSL